MMLKDLAAIQQHQLAAAADENMSNLTSASGDQASVSSHPAPPLAKKKRSLPGNPGQPCIRIYRFSNSCTYHGFRLDRCT
jgi:hypothetical protein